MARFLLRKIFARLGRGPHDKKLRVVFADGSVYQNFSGDGPSDATVRFRSRWAEWYALIFFYEGLLEAYVNEEVDIEGERPLAALAEMGHRLGIVPAAFWQRLLRNPLNATRQWVQELRQNNTSRAQSIRNADFHYGFHPALFEQMLGDTVGYSEGLWAPDTTTLDQAKFNNYEYICRKLCLAPGLRVLEVGAGWGYMPIYMAKRYGAEVTVYNPVRRQNDYMRERFHRHGLGDRIRLIEGDHRDIAREAGAFDRFVSIGVHEHAGYSRRQYRLWAESIAAALKTGGIGVVSTTSFMLRQMTNFVSLKYIFPGGHLPCLGDTLAAFDRAGLTLVEVENLWPHYQRTLVEWRKNFGERWPEIQKADPAVFNERFRRRWQMYLEGTYEVFRDSLDLSHIVFTKGRGADFYPRLRGANHVEAELIGGKTDPECYR
jgi:cyclopropane-fatty-acyl-phospholipid synthase